MTQVPLSALQSVAEQPAARSVAANAHETVTTINKSAASASAASEAGVLGQQYTTGSQHGVAEQATAAAHDTAADAAMQPSGMSPAPQAALGSAAQAGAHAAVADPAKLSEDTGKAGKTSKHKREGPVKQRLARNIFFSAKRQQVGLACRQFPVEHFALQAQEMSEQQLNCRISMTVLLPVTSG